MYEEEGDIITETGKSLRLSSNDIAWCTTGNCTVYLIISTRSAPQAVYQVSARSATRREIIRDQISNPKSFEFTRGAECLSLNVEKSSSDVVIDVRTH